MNELDSKDVKDGFDLIEYPCEYQFKAVCKTTPDIQALIQQLAADVIGDANVVSVESRPSKNNRFTSVTVTTKLTDRAELEGVYDAIANSEWVIMTL